MTVTEITELTRSRLRIETDAGPSFVLYKGELRSYGIQEGQELGQEAYCEIMEVLLPQRARKRVLNLLKNRAYTSAQLQEKLKAGGYPEQIARQAVDYAAGFGYVDDGSYAADFIEYNKESKSQMRIFMDLHRKGIPEPVIREKWDEAVCGGEQELEKEQIRGWAKKKNFSPETATFQEKQRIMSFLYRKGFSIDNIRSVLSLDINSFCV